MNPALPLVLVMLAPSFAAAGEPSVDTRERASRDVPASEMLGREVFDESGGAMGTVDDVILDARGKVLSIVVSHDAVQAENTSATMGGIEGASSLVANAPASDGERLVLEWESVSLDPENLVLQANRTDGARPTYDEAGAIAVSEIIGMNVDLADEESFGEVEEVMIDTAQGRASSIVVDSMQFFEKERYALPANLANVDAQAGSIAIPRTRSEVEESARIDETTRRDE